MAKKTEILLVKKAMVEAVLEAMETRAAHPTAKPEAQAGDMWDKMMQNFTDLTAMKIIGGVAVIPIRGTITPDDPFAILYGETSLVDFTSNLQAAVDDPKVKAVILNAYTPGGYVYGVEAASNAVYEARRKKPIYGYTDSLAASAGYWLISAASKIFLGSETAEVGSIGVYLAHFDYSGMLEQAGVKVTEITAGEFKGIGSPYSELSAEDKKLLQSDVNYIYTRFVNTVARNRGMSVKDLLKSANGLTFYGAEAISLGLADSISTFQEVLQMAQADGGTAANVTEDAKKAEAAEARAAKAEADKLAADAELKKYREKDAAEARGKLDVECNTAYKEAFGRDATTEEKDTYAKADEGQRKALTAALKESTASRDKLVKAAGLTTEVATEGQEDAKDPNKSPLVLAAKHLGLA